jgi:arabinofuranan 3-O-arabinosyltransferase
VLATAKRAQLTLSQARRLSVATGVVALLALAFVPEGSLADRVALAALIALGFGTALGWLQMQLQGRPVRAQLGQVEARSARTWFLVTIGVLLVAGLAVQTWFQPGTSIAGGDILPPDGTAWLGRVFEPWTWAGSSLGEPSQLPLALPWAVVLGMVHALGGDPATAQRIWYTVLFVGAALGALGLMAALRLGPIAAVVGSVVFVFNPYVVSEVNTYAVYMAAVGLLAALPAVLVAAGTGRLSTWWAAALIAVASPMLGYTFFNPPLVGLILGATLATPLLVGWIDGKHAGVRSFRALLLAVPLLLATSAYWIVPTILHLSGFAGSQLVSLSSWTWTEGRATLRNAFWLNAIWGWSFPEYYPYAPAYDGLLLKVAAFGLPAIAFSAVALQARTRRDQSFGRDRELRLVVAAATVALTLIFISTGTNAPGNTVFDPLYKLPFGWLLREPGRFLMLVALAYALLSAVVVQTLVYRKSVIEYIRYLVLSAGGVQGMVNRQSVVASLRSRRLVNGVFRLAIAPLVLGISLLMGFPLYTGAVVPDSRPGLPPVHVRLPGYWTEMARLVDGLPTQGALLVMPPDDFYQMPYSWGYYGADGFIVEMFHRPVLVPNGQGYSPASSQVMGAVNLTAQSILHRDWRQAETLVRALNTPLVLVRGDIDEGFPGRSIVAPDDLAAALTGAPNFTLVRKIGSLELFSLIGMTTESEVGATFATIDTQTPDLRLLSLLPPNTALVSSESHPGVSNIVQAPPLQLWQATAEGFVWQPTAPLGWAYRIAELDSKTIIPLDHAGVFKAEPSSVHIVYVRDVASNSITVSVPGRIAISNGDFTNGLWGPVGDCYDVNPAQANLRAKVISSGAPRGLPALQLSASFDSACESQSIGWSGGPLVLSLMIHPVQGAAPRICVWEFGPNQCASLPSIANQTGWSVYHASISPDAGTSAIALFLYADAGAPGTRTVNEYADVRVVEVPALPSLTLLSDPTAQSSPSAQLVVLHRSFSNDWVGPISGKHVLVDGMLNGWLIPIGLPEFSAYYKPANVLLAAQWTSLVTLLVLLLFSAGRRVGRYIVARSTKL